MAKSRPKRTYHHGDLQQALIDAALGLIAEKQDVHTLSLREVARRVGVSQAAPYRHFADKEALLAAVAEEGFHQLLVDLQDSMVTPAADPLAALQASGVAYVQFAVSHPAHYRVMFGAFQVDNATYPALHAVGCQTFAVLVDAIATGQQAGQIITGDPQTLARVAWSLVHGLAMLVIDGQISLTQGQDIAALASFTTQSLIQGIQR
ncbi:HTH-type transcriptional repressor FabR [Halomicronema hongdechloris C2206]|uniref:HTH-type transcriptional repressor FabR n=1 Tax=Halomicronema hongdechloris C2206 TaxID=1641165 RepID=A0A1Z3HNS8_9CYAN|nr:TetR/AcrR family transcriptional regulator [Halomicronema hongdechloris]ASC71949.1 HTH-type transcriptional repressor FabR [Halomicronema hongdechloris C2206]